MWVYWLIFAFTLLAIEAGVGGLVFVFFALGAIVAAPFSLSMEITWQIILFVLTSILSLILFRTKLRNQLQTPKSTTPEHEHPMDDFLGKKAIVCQQIHGEIGGRIEFNGSTWTAKSTELISVGQIVLITHTEGMSLWVKPI